MYRADIEMNLRTPEWGGFQLLDLQDYPGQGSAYVGILDAFMESKGLDRAGRMAAFLFGSGSSVLHGEVLLDER